MSQIYFDIQAIGISLGEDKINPSSLFSDDDGRVAKKTGINILHRTKKSSYDLAVESVRNLKNFKDYVDKIGCVIYVTQSAVNFLPNHASNLQGDIGISKSAICFDINQGCSGFVQALLVMVSMLNTFGIEFGLIVCTDTYSHHLNKSDRSTQSLFSDGATSVIISKSKKWMLVDSAHVTDGKKADFLKKPIDNDVPLNMEGSKIFQWTRSELGKSIKSLLIKNGLSVKDIDYFFIHQASKMVMNNVALGLGINSIDLPSTLNITGNLVSSSIPFLLSNYFEEFSKSEKIIFSGFGVGLSMSTCLLENVSR